MENYITTLKDINGALGRLRYEIGTAGLFDSKAPSLVLKSKTNQNKLNDLMAEMETINNEIIRHFRVF